MIVTYSPDNRNDVLVMQGSWVEESHIIFAIHWEFKLVILQEYSGTITFCCLKKTKILSLAIYRVCIVYWLPKLEQALGLENKHSRRHLQTNQNHYSLYQSKSIIELTQVFSTEFENNLAGDVMFFAINFFVALSSEALCCSFISKLPLPTSENANCRTVKSCFW